MAWHTLLFLPLAFPGARVLLLAAPLAAAGHLVVDAVSARLPLHASRALERTFLDQNPFPAAGGPSGSWNGSSSSPW